MTLFIAKKLTLRHIFISIFSILPVVVLFKNTSSAKTGILKGLMLCGEVLIPSLFLFSVISYFLFSTPILALISTICDKFSKAVFKLSGKEFAVMLFSFIAGYPIGASITNELLKTKQTDQKTAQRMLLFTVNSGPAFIVVAIGEILLNSKSDGIRLLLCHVLASLFLAFISGLFIKREYIEYENQKSFEPLSDCFVTAVSKGCLAMINICGFALLFSAVREILVLDFGKETANLLSSFLDVTVSVVNFATRSNLSLISFFLGFGGISVQCQVLYFARDIKLSYIKLFSQRTLNGSVAFCISLIVEKLFPRSVETFSNSVTPIFQISSSSIVSAVALMFLCVFFLLFLSRKESEKFNGLIRKKVIQ